MKLCVALDLNSRLECENLARKLSGLDLWLKVGLRTFIRDGYNFIENLKKIGDFKIFLDLKFYDIPNTTADVCEECAKMGVEMINIHTSAGALAMREVMQRLNKLSQKPLVLGVSALTSFDEASFWQIYKQNINEAVLNLARISYENGLDGMVCSAFESALIKENTSSNFITLTPGIRPFNEASNDQKRVADLAFAKKQKSDFVVIGRPIYEANNPREISEKILQTITILD